MAGRPCHIYNYGLAEKLLIPQMQNEVLHLLNTVGQTCLLPFVYSLHGIYANTSEDSPLRRFVVNLLAWSLESDGYKRRSDLYPNAFLLDLATVFSAAVPERTARNRRARADVRDYYVEERSREATSALIASGIFCRTFHELFSI